MPKRASATSPSNSPPPRHGVTRPSSRKQRSKDTARPVNNRTQPQQEQLLQAGANIAPVVDLAQVAAVIPAENLQQLATAVQSGRWLFAVWHVADGRLHLERTATNFPTVDLEKSVAMLAENLKELSHPN